MKKSLRQAVEVYLATRRRLGFALRTDGFELRGFVRYAEQIGHTGPLRAHLAIQWARQPEKAGRIYWASRLDMVRRFACFWLAYDPRTEIPPRGFFGPTVRRRAVHVYTRQEVLHLFQGAAALGALHPLRGETFRTLLGLLGLAESRGYIQNWLQGQSIPEKSAQRIFGAADKILKAGALS